MCYKESKIDAITSVLDGKSCSTGNVNISREKKEKGLYERTEECKVMLTEDNKMLLKD